MNHDERVAASALSRLAAHAPVYRSGQVPARTRSGSRAALFGAAAAVTLAAALTGVAAVMGPNDRPSAPGAAGAGGAETSQGIHGNGQTGGTTMRLAGVTGWSEARASSCAAWTPGRGDAVVRLARLDDRCVGLAPMDATTVFVAPSGEGLFGQGWDEMTAPWRRVGDHSLRRLSSGPLVEMSAHVADGVVCTECDEVILVLGPDPEQVRGLVESVTVP